MKCLLLLLLSQILIAQSSETDHWKYFLADIESKNDEVYRSSSIEMNGMSTGISVSVFSEEKIFLGVATRICTQSGPRLITPAHVIENRKSLLNQSKENLEVLWRDDLSDLALLKEKNTRPENSCADLATNFHPPIAYTPEAFGGDIPKELILEFPVNNGKSFESKRIFTTPVLSIGDGFTGHGIPGRDDTGPLGYLIGEAFKGYSGSGILGKTGIFDDQKFLSLMAFVDFVPDTKLIGMILAIDSWSRKIAFLSSAQILKKLNEHGLEKKDLKTKVKKIKNGTMYLDSGAIHLRGHQVLSGSGGMSDTGSGGMSDTGSGGMSDTGSGGMSDTGSGGMSDTGSGGMSDTGSDQMAINDSSNMINKTDEKVITNFNQLKFFTGILHEEKIWRFLKNSKNQFVWRELQGASKEVRQLFLRPENIEGIYEKNAVLYRTSLNVDLPDLYPIENTIIYRLGKYFPVHDFHSFEFGHYIPSKIRQCHLLEMATRQRKNHSSRINPLVVCKNYQKNKRIIEFMIQTDYLNEGKAFLYSYFRIETSFSHHKLLVNACSRNYLKSYSLKNRHKDLNQEALSSTDKDCKKMNHTGLSIYQDETNFLTIFPDGGLSIEVIENVNVPPTVSEGPSTLQTMQNLFDFRNR